MSHRQADETWAVVPTHWRVKFSADLAGINVKQTVQSFLKNGIIQLRLNFLQERLRYLDFSRSRI